MRVAHGFEPHEHDLPYDHLVVALGSITNFYGLPGLEQRALTMKTLGDAIHLRNRVIATLEEADTECAARRRRPADLRRRRRRVRGRRDDCRPERLRARSAPVLPAADAGSRAHGARPRRDRSSCPSSATSSAPMRSASSRRAGIEIVTDAKVSGVTEQAVTLADGRQIPQPPRRLDRGHVAASAHPRSAVPARSRAHRRRRDAGGSRPARRLGAGRLRGCAGYPDRQAASADRAACAARGEDGRRQHRARI